MKNHLSSLIGQAKSMQDGAERRLHEARQTRDQLDAKIPLLEGEVAQLRDGHYGLILIAGRYSGEE